MAKEEKTYGYYITKEGMDDWYLYSVEDCNFGKKISWTSDFAETIVFSTEEKVETFKENLLKNAPVIIHRFLKNKFPFIDF